jgi:hypothetical protein
MIHNNKLAAFLFLSLSQGRLFLDTEFSHCHVAPEWKKVKLDAIMSYGKKNFRFI